MMRDGGLQHPQNNGHLQPIMKVEEVKRDSKVMGFRNFQWGLCKEEGESSRHTEVITQRSVEDQMLDLNVSLANISNQPQEEDQWKTSVGFDLNTQSPGREAISR